MSREPLNRHQASKMLPPETSDPGTKPPSEQERLRLIQQRAYQLWEQTGKPDGADSKEVFWIAAERE
jgi:Protein of unknown function (DUF2934)